MTREEVNWYIDNLKLAIKQNCLDENYIEAIDALKTQPCGDCVSREAIETYVREYGEKHNGCNWIDNSVLYKFLKNLPPVTPKQRTGKWILVRNKLGATIDRICSCCNRSHEKTSDFCPNCGAKMEGE